MPKEVIPTICKRTHESYQLYTNSNKDYNYRTLVWFKGLKMKERSSPEGEDEFTVVIKCHIFMLTKQMRKTVKSERKCISMIHLLITAVVSLIPTAFMSCNSD